MLKKIFLLSQLLILVGCGKTELKKQTILKGDYLGQIHIKDSATVFAPNTISTEFNVRDAALSPIGDEFFYSLKGTANYSLIQLNRKDNNWDKAKVAEFSGKYSDLEPCYSHDGMKLYFVSNRPINESGEPKDYDIWFVEKTKLGWGKPKNLGSPINTSANEFYPSFTKDGTIYFCANYKSNIGGEDLFYSTIENGKYTKPVNLGDSINTTRDEYNSFVANDESYIIFTSMGLGKGFGNGDLWISFNKGNRNWTKAVNLGNLVNTKFFEFCPSLTNDGKYLFFTSNRNNIERFSESAKSYNQIVNELQSIFNGSFNIFWIKTDFIEEIKEKVIFTINI